MKKIFYSLIFTSYLLAAEDMISRIILFIIFIGLAVAGYKFIRLRTGNYDIDYFTKLLGWVLIIPAIWGIIDSIKESLK